MPPSPTCSIRLGACTFEIWPAHVRTILPLGEVTAAPQDDDDYGARAVELGYGADRFAMCRDHELVHCWLAALLGLDASPALTAVATGRPLSAEASGIEEAAVLAVQRFARSLGVDLVDAARRWA